MAINITMPALSPTMEEGTLAKWLVKPGDTISSGDVIAEIETDKATMEVEAVDEGTIAKILVDAGTAGVKVNSVIAVLAEEGEDPDEVEAPKDAGGSLKKEESSKKEEAAQTKAPEQEDKPAPKSEKPESDSAKKSVSSELGSTPMKLADVGDGGDRIKASPLARRLAKLRGSDLSNLKGSGPTGRIGL